MPACANENSNAAIFVLLERGLDQVGNSGALSGVILFRERVNLDGEFGAACLANACVGTGL